MADGAGTISFTIETDENARKIQSFKRSIFSFCILLHIFCIQVRKWGNEAKIRADWAGFIWELEDSETGNEATNHPGARSLVRASCLEIFLPVD
jgi:hypothetical protein